MIHNKNMNKVAVFASAIVIIGGLVAIPAFTSGHEAQAAFPKDQAKKVTNLIKKVVSKIFNRGGGNPGGTGDGVGGGTGD